MREAYFVEVDGDFKYSFGSDISIIAAVIKHKNSKCFDYLEYKVQLTGKELIRFINKSAKEHIKVIENIDKNKNYILVALDW